MSNLMTSELFYEYIVNMHRGSLHTYYTVARRYEFYVRVARTILFLLRGHKIHFSELMCNEM